MLGNGQGRDIDFRKEAKSKGTNFNLNLRRSSRKAEAGDPRGERFDHQERISIKGNLERGDRKKKNISRGKEIASERAGGKLAA